MGISLRILGARQKNQKILCDGLQSHDSAWKTFSDWNITHESSIAAKELTLSIKTLEQQFSSQEVSRCLAKSSARKGKA
jgi:Ca2+-binding EF-hand superfamily protein